MFARPHVSIPFSLLAHIDRGSGMAPAWYRPVQDHARRVAALANQIALAYGLRAERRRALVAGALWHDIGKLGVSPAILGKRGPLSGSERALVRRHPAIGLRLVRSLDLPAVAARVVYEHHERWDGGGYPDRIAGRAIAPEAQIVSVADVFDAMVSERPYKAALPPDEAIGFIVEQRERMFAPDILDAALPILAQRVTALGPVVSV
jgi:diguanylate cyclase